MNFLLVTNAMLCCMVIDVVSQLIVTERLGAAWHLARYWYTPVTQQFRFPPEQFPTVMALETSRVQVFFAPKSNHLSKRLVSLVKPLCHFEGDAGPVLSKD